MSFRTPTALLTGVALLIGCGEGRPDVRPIEEEGVAPPYTDITVAQLQEMMVESGLPPDLVKGIIVRRRIYVRH